MATTTQQEPKPGFGDQILSGITTFGNNVSGFGNGFVQSINNWGATNLGLAGGSTSGMYSPLYNAREGAGALGASSGSLGGVSLTEGLGIAGAALPGLMEGNIGKGVLGAAGAYGGLSAGAALGSVLGSWGGPVGMAIGATLGNYLGGKLFNMKSVGPNANTVRQYAPKTDGFWANVGSGSDNGMTTEFIDSYANDIQKVLNDVAKASGVSFIPQGRFGTSIYGGQFMGNLYDPRTKQYVKGFEYNPDTGGITLGKDPTAAARSLMLGYVDAFAQGTAEQKALAKALIEGKAPPPKAPEPPKPVTGPPPQPQQMLPGGVSYWMPTLNRDTGLTQRTESNRFGQAMAAQMGY